MLFFNFKITLYSSEKYNYINYLRINWLLSWSKRCPNNSKFTRYFPGLMLNSESRAAWIICGKSTNDFYRPSELNGSKIGYLLFIADISFVLLKMLCFILKFSLIKFETPDVLISTPNSFIVATDNSDWLLKTSLYT